MERNRSPLLTASINLQLWSLPAEAADSVEQKGYPHRALVLARPTESVSIVYVCFLSLGFGVIGYRALATAIYSVIPTAENVC